ncbi:hypothetical protein [Caballeronia catudaia]|uniref:hypothetical protein n=1 Tax=Caballeronia catudaia TaxID=1777136 RepID=UPI0007729C97|nr:hypothetical protein [Caballeronia catudaia]
MLPEGAITVVAALLVLVDPLAGAGLDAARGAEAPLSGGVVVLPVLPESDGLAELDCETPAVLGPSLPPPHAASTNAAASAGNTAIHRAENKRRIFEGQTFEKRRLFSVMARSED